MKLTAVQDTLCEESLLICVISDQNPVVHPKLSYPIYILPYFGIIWPYRIYRVHIVFLSSVNRHRWEESLNCPVALKGTREG